MAIVVKGVEKYAETFPVVVRAEDVAFASDLFGKPNGHSVSADSIAAGNLHGNLDLPIAAIQSSLRPYGAFLTLQRRRDTNLFVRSDRTAAVHPKWYCSVFVCHKFEKIFYM